MDSISTAPPTLTRVSGRDDGGGAAGAGVEPVRLAEALTALADLGERLGETALAREAAEARRIDGLADAARRATARRHETGKAADERRGELDACLAEVAALLESTGAATHG
jgi:hypothetical protein